MIAKLELDFEIAQLIQREFVFSLQIARYHFRAMLGEVTGQSLSLSGKTQDDDPHPFPILHIRLRITWLWTSFPSIPTSNRFRF